jgi:hypothetical protein
MHEFGARHDSMRRPVKRAVNQVNLPIRHVLAAVVRIFRHAVTPISNILETLKDISIIEEILINAKIKKVRSKCVCFCP